MQAIVSGAAGHLGRVLLPKLCDDAAVTGVIAIDRIAPTFAHAKLRFFQADIRDDTALRLAGSADVVIHLAFQLLRGQCDVDTMFANNVEASRALLSAAHLGGARIVHLSSAAVYGSGVDLKETAPFAPLPGFLYAQHKAEVERWLGVAAPNAIRLRPHMILGCHALPLLKRLARLPFYVPTAEPEPRFQCVHEEDVADAILLCLKRPAAGPFNLSAPLPFTPREAARTVLRAAPPVPLPAAKAVFRLMNRLTGWGGETGWLEAFRRSLTLDCSRAQEVLGWRPRHGDWREIVATCEE